MTKKDANASDSYRKARAQLIRMGVKVNSRTSRDIVLAHVLRITGRSIGKTPQEASRELNLFAERDISFDLPKRPWRPLKGYEAQLFALQRTAEATR